MGSAVNFLGGFGPVPAEPVPQGIDMATAADGVFAALIAQAAHGVDAAAVVPEPELPEGVIHRVFVAEWCLTVPDEVTETSSECATVEETEVTNRQAEKPDEAPGIIIDTAYLEWLRAQPVPPAPVPPAAVPPPAEGNTPETVGVEPPRIVRPVLVAESAAPAPIEAPKPAPIPVAHAPEQPELPELQVAEPPSATRPGSELPDELTPVEPRETAPIPVRVRPQSQPLPASMMPVDDLPAASVEALPTAPAETGADLTSTFQAEEPQVENAARPRAASAQLARAIERSGVTASTVVAVPAAPDNSGQSTTSERGSSPTASHESALGAGASARVAQPISFAAHVAAEVQRTPAPTVVQVTAPAEGATAAAPDSTTTDQLVQAMKLQFRDGIGDAVVRLKPEHLGEVSISLRVEQQSVTATVHAEVAAVRAWLESQEGQLRQGLSDQGLHLQKFVVREDESREQERETPQPQQQKRRHPRPQDEEERFEVIV